MLSAFALGVAFVGAAVPALPFDVEPIVRDCSTSQYGDLGRDWKRRAVVAGPLAFVGMRQGYGRASVRPAAPHGRAWPLKVLVVVEPRAVATVTIAARSRTVAALGYNSIRHSGEPVPLAAGSQSVRFEACSQANARAREVWNRGTQFGGYFLVACRACVHVDVATGTRPTVLRRTLRFGLARCAA